MPRKLLVGGLQRTSSTKGAKKVPPPTVPTLSVKAAHFKARSPCICDDGDSPGLSPADSDSEKPPRSPTHGPNLFIQPFYNSLANHQPPPMKKMTQGGGSNGQIHLAHVIVHSQPDSLPSTPSDTGHSPSLSKARLLSGVSLEDQGIDVSSPGRHSPGGSSGGSSISRHSLSSLDSGRASAPGSEGKVVNRRLSIQSYEGSSPQRRSYHSSSSSIASVENDIGPGPNVAEMVLHGFPDVEVLSSWLATLHFEEYIPLFLLAGYDMPTITRMTPEDLTAIGITKPNHRRKLKAEIAKLNISDGIPEYKPDSLLEWLQLLRLEEYFDTLYRQNYNTIDKVTDLTWEDLEDIGIQKLGHQKRILLAIKRIEDINHGRRPNLYPQTSTHSNRTAVPAGGCSTFPRPSTLSNAQQLQYTSQEIAISTHRPKTSPSTDSIPEMKTFQQSPIREETLFMHSMHNSTQNISVSHHHNGISSTVLSPTRGRSLESLHSENSMISPLLDSRSDSPPPPPAPPMIYKPQLQPTAQSLSQSMIHQPTQLPLASQPLVHQQPSPLISKLITQPPQAAIQQQQQPPQPAIYQPLPPSQVAPEPLKTTAPTKDWRVTDLDQEYSYECEGTATLNRPKGMVRLKPMAKIAAKTREEIAEAIMDIPDSEFKSLINQTRALDGWSSLEGSPRHGPSTVPRSATLKRAPPPVPKRNPAKIDKGRVELPKIDLKTKSEQPVKELPIPKAEPLTLKLKSDAREASRMKQLEPINSEEFPPPPSPLPSATDEKSDSKDELFNNPLFRQRQKGSSDSMSSVDSTILPFANETVGTIKQKVVRPYPSLPTNASQRASKASTVSENSTTGNVVHEYDITPDAISPGDVIDDIENMLANLSDQLDAVLDEEVQK